MFAAISLRRERSWRSRCSVSAASRLWAANRSTTLRTRVCAPDGDESKIFEQPERIVDRRMRVSRGDGVADAEQLKSSVLVVNSRLGSAGDQILIVNRAKVR